MDFSILFIFFFFLLFAAATQFKSHANIQVNEKLIFKSTIPVIIDQKNYYNVREYYLYNEKLCTINQLFYLDTVKIHEDLSRLIKYLITKVLYIKIN